LAISRSRPIGVGDLTVLSGWNVALGTRRLADAPAPAAFSTVQQAASRAAPTVVYASSRRHGATVPIATFHPERTLSHRHTRPQPAALLRQPTRHPDRVRWFSRLQFNSVQTECVGSLAYSSTPSRQSGPGSFVLRRTDPSAPRTEGLPRIEFRISTNRSIALAPTNSNFQNLEMRVRLVVQHELAALHARRSRASRGSRDSNVDGSGDRRSHGDQKRPAFDVGAHRSEFDCAPQRRYRAKPSERSAAAELSSIFIVRTRPQPFGVQPRCCAQRSAHGNSQSGVARSASRTDASSPLSARYCITTADSHEVLGRSNVARLLDSSSRDARITSTRVHVATGISMELLDGGDLEGSSRKRSHWRQLTSTRRRDSAVRTTARVCDSRDGKSLRFARRRESAIRATARVCDSRGGESLRFARRRESASARLGAPASRGFLRRILV